MSAARPPQPTASPPGAATGDGGLCVPPVALFVYNRPELAAQVFAAVRAARPRHLLVVADGPRSSRPGDAERCVATRAVVASPDWPCKVSTNFADENLGCRRRMASGLDWVFATVEEAIILEDDCVPDPTFFRYCGELLQRFRGEERVMHVGGTNFLPGRDPGDQSYVFSRYPHVWGWASWRRAWRHYDVLARAWSAGGRRDQLLATFPRRRERLFWERTWDAVAAGSIDSWDYQWVLACVAAGGLAVSPAVNLITNIGFGADATHTRGANATLRPRRGALTFPLRHPAACTPDAARDAALARKWYSTPGLVGRLWALARRLRGAT